MFQFLGTCLLTGWIIPVREEPSSSETPTPESHLRPAPPSAAPMPPSPNVEDQTPESLQAQEEYLRTLLRSQQPLSQNTPEQYPTTKLLSSVLGINPPD